MTPKQGQMNNFQQTQIAMWGPTGAGKDWLILSFAKELEYYNSLNRQEREFHYELGELQLGDSIPLPLSPEPPIDIAPTTDVDDLHYIFERIPVIQDSSHITSSFRHDIMIHNDKGQNLVDCLQDPYSFEGVYQNLISSQNIFLVLGIPIDKAQTENFSSALSTDLMNEVQFDGNKTPAQATAWRVRDYVQFMRLLLAAIGRNTRRNLAVCMTKSDQTMNLKGNPWDILQHRYSLELRNHLEINRQWHNIEVFNTSAAGFIKRNGRPDANFSNGKLLDPERWRPVNTATPFFWIFEQIERASLPPKSIFGKDPQKNYIGYPYRREI
jgi:hypothetical protein